EEAHAANAIKLAGNFLITTVIESLAEAFAFGRKFGVDPHAFLDILTNSLFQAPVYRNYGSMIASDKFEPAGFRLPLGFKDNRLLLAAAEGPWCQCRWRAWCTIGLWPRSLKGWANPIGLRSLASPTRTRVCVRRSRKIIY